MEAHARQRNSQIQGLIFAGVGGLVMTGAIFFTWRWWKARPATNLVNANVASASSAAISPASAPLGPTVPTQAAPDMNATKPSLDQLQQRLKELRENNAKEAERLKQGKGGVMPMAPPLQEVPPPTKQVLTNPEPQTPTPALPATTHIPVPWSPSAASLSPPRILSRAAPNFPRRAKELHFESTKDHVVRLRVMVDERGRPSDITVLEGVPGVFGFNQEAIAAAQRTTYAPATKGGIAQRETIEVVYIFKAER